MHVCVCVCVSSWKYIHMSLHLPGAARLACVRELGILMCVAVSPPPGGGKGERGSSFHLSGLRTDVNCPAAASGRLAAAAAALLLPGTSDPLAGRAGVRLCRTRPLLCPLAPVDGVGVLQRPLRHAPVDLFCGSHHHLPLHPDPVVAVGTPVAPQQWWDGTSLFLLPRSLPREVDPCLCVVWLLTRRP